MSDTDVPDATTTTQQESRSPVVFISHAGPDIEHATWVAVGLKKAGIVPRLDQTDIHFGDNVVTWMNNSLQESDYLLVLLSPISVTRYWVELEWSNALMKEADLHRTFVVPAVLPGLEDSRIPSLLRCRSYLDFRADREKAFLQFVSRLKGDELAHRDLGRYPSPAPSSMQQQIEEHLPNDGEALEVIVHSNRFGRAFRLRVPSSATPKYLMGKLRDALNLKFSNVDNAMGIELSYEYYLQHNGQPIPLNTSLSDAGVKNDDRLELWIRVIWRDLIERKDLGTQVTLHRLAPITNENSKLVVQTRDREISSDEIKNIVSKFFAHVDK